MKPFLPFAVLVVLLVFLAGSKAQTPAGRPALPPSLLEGPRPARASSGLAQSFEQFQKKVKELTNTVMEKTKEVTLDFTTKTRNWFTENIQKVKEKLESTFSKKH
ncbi:apolipoprotein C-I [Gracilinanus agilis]|uniref:apolipoprotein C-I n=1 Tax=Gracilinanus agilis TaxID=191870 RepID=UPI001CFE17A9|nr:apolipoprotein C-I [Gracilinanus agilis]